MMRKMKQEMDKNKANLAKDSNPNGMTRDQIKYAELGMELETLTSSLNKETGFLTHLKKLAKQIDSEYDEKVTGKRNPDRRKSVNRSPDASSPDHRSSIGGRTPLTGGKKLDTRGSLNSSISPTMYDLQKGRMSLAESSQSPKHSFKPIPSTKKAVFKEYTQSRGETELSYGSKIKPAIS